MAANLDQPEVNPGAQEPTGSAKSPSGGPRRIAVLVVSLLAIGVTGYMVWDAMAKQDTQLVKAELMCSIPECGFSEVRPLKLGETLPAQCPKCGKQSMYTSMACPNCKTPNVLLQDQGLPGPTKCSRCGTELKYGE